MNGQSIRCISIGSRSILACNSCWKGFWMFTIVMEEITESNRDFLAFLKEWNMAGSQKRYTATRLQHSNISNCDDDIIYFWALLVYNRMLDEVCFNSDGDWCDAQVVRMPLCTLQRNPRNPDISRIVFKILLMKKSLAWYNIKSCWTLFQ